VSFSLLHFLSRTDDDILASTRKSSANITTKAQKCRTRLYEDETTESVRISIVPFISLSVQNNTEGLGIRGVRTRMIGPRRDRVNV